MRLKDLDPDFLLCRDLRHQWELTSGSMQADKENALLWRTAVCLRCGSERVERIDTDAWRVTARWYNHPSGYVLTERVPFSEIRKASLQRQLASRNKGKEALR